MKGERSKVKGERSKVKGCAYLKWVIKNKSLMKKVRRQLQKGKYSFTLA